MKAVISIFLLIIIFAFSGEKHQHNTSILPFVYENIGKKVGTGICHDFVVQAEDTKYADWNTDYYLTDKFAKHQVYFSELQKGDIILLDGIVLNEEIDTIQHIGIYMGRKESIIVFASQNLGGHGQKEVIVDYKGTQMSVFEDSKVELSTIDLRDITYGRAYFFRF
jgi:hypothetical protein